MHSLFNFQFGDFAETNPNWFDWFSLVASFFISILSVVGGFLIATEIYKRGRKDKEKEERELQASEVRLLKNSLSQLKAAVENQIENLERYIADRNFSLQFNSGVHADFLHFVNIRYLYKDIGIDNKVQINKLNKLLSSLYELGDFRVSLRDELRSYMGKYNFHEEKFYSYRKLLYTKYFEFCNQRGKDFILENGIKRWRFSDDDHFMINYTETRNKIFNDNEVMAKNGLKDRDRLVERFVIPLINNSADFIPEDYNAIELTDIANEVNSAYIDMEHVTNSHFEVMKSYLGNLQDVKAKIDEFLN